MVKINEIKGSLDLIYLIFEINVGNGRIRLTTILKSSDECLDRLKINSRFIFRVVICRIRPFPTLISQKRLGSELSLNLLVMLKKLVSDDLMTNL